MRFTVVLSLPLSSYKKILWLLAISHVQSQNSHGFGSPFSFSPSLIPNSSDQNRTGWKGKMTLYVCVCMHACLHPHSHYPLGSLSGTQRAVHSTVWTGPWGEEEKGRGGSNNFRGYSANLKRICLIWFYCSPSHRHLDSIPKNLSIVFFLHCHIKHYKSLNVTRRHLVTVIFSHSRLSFYLPGEVFSKLFHFEKVHLSVKSLHECLPAFEASSSQCNSCSSSSLRHSSPRGELLKPKCHVQKSIYTKEDSKNQRKLS